MNNLALSESTPIDSIVYTLEGYDPEGEQVTFGLIGSDNFDVNPRTGDVKVVKSLDREVCCILSFLFLLSKTINFKQTYKIIQWKIIIDITLYQKVKLYSPLIQAFILLTSLVSMSIIRYVVISK